MLKRDLIVLCLLHLLKGADRYGYELMRPLREAFPDTEESAIYALLRQLCREIESLIHAGENHLPQDEALHIRIARCTRNRVVPKLLPVVAYSVQLFGALNDARIYEETIETHRQIIDAIAAHDEEAARDAMYRHLSGNLRAIESAAADE